PVPPPAVVKVDEWLAPPGRPSLVGRGRETALFVNARGGRLSRQAAWALVRQRGKNAGLGEAVGPQLLRHTCAAHLVGERVALAAKLRETLGEVEHALAKLDEGKYGRCENCGKPIQPARLEAMPAARLCIDCASKR